jgi:hypothetical protein
MQGDKSYVKSKPLCQIFGGKFRRENFSGRCYFLLKIRAKIVAMGLVQFYGNNGQGERER